MLESDSCAAIGPSFMLRRSQKSTVLGAIKKIKNGYIGGARVVSGRISDFFRTTSVSKLDLSDSVIEAAEDLLAGETGAVPRSLPPTEKDSTDHGRQWW